MKNENYTTWHEIKDLVMIYHEDEWDNAKVTLWHPIEQQEYNLVFCGSSKGEINQINFIASSINEQKWTNDEKKAWYLRVMAANCSNSDKTVYKWAKGEYLKLEND